MYAYQRGKGGRDKLGDWVDTYTVLYIKRGFPGSSVVKNPPANTRDAASIPGQEDSPGEGNCNPLQHSCLDNPMDREAWWATVHQVAKELKTTSN